MAYQKFEERAIYQSIHNLGLWLTPHVGKWPKWVRPTLGHQVMQCWLDIFRACTSGYASQAPQKLRYLQQAGAELDGLRLLLRLSVSLRLTSIRQFEHASGLAGELGKQLGGWISSLSKG